MNWNAIRWLVVVLIALGAAGGVYYYYQDSRPCVHPVAYALGTVDPRFETSTLTLLTTAKAAATIWNDAAKRTVLVYDPAATLKISLIYDEREATAKLGREIARRQAELDTARAAIAVLEKQFTAAQDAYNQKVSAVNARGGATKSEAAALNAERRSLESLETSLRSQVTIYNSNVRAMNTIVAQYNQMAGRTFEQGQYVSDAAGRRINIFEFIGTTQLKRVLAHEFGHAIGLGHNDDPDSIMFAKNESGNLVPTEADLAALRSLCGA